MKDSAEQSNPSTGYAERGPDLRGPAAIVDGSVIGGFTFIGPFATVEAASEWHTKKRLVGYLGLPVTIVLLEKPKQEVFDDQA